MTVQLICFMAAAAAANEPLEGSGGDAGTRVASISLDGANPRRACRWELDAPLDASLTVRASAGSALVQTHSVRATVVRGDGTAVAGTQLLVGESKTFSFSLAAGTYYLVYDLGVEDLEADIGALFVDTDGVTVNPITMERVPIEVEGTPPPDPANPAPSHIFLPGPLPFTLDDFIPLPPPPSLEMMQIIVDVA